MHVNLHLTHACNLRCTYCYTGAKAERHMSWEVARRAVDFALARSTGAAQITFFGGEPLLCMDLMRRVVQRARRGARKKGSHVQFELSTNGTLVDSAFRDFVREEQIFVSLSIDGARRAHDAHRVFPDRSGSHQLVSAALRSLLAASPLTMTMSVVTPETVSSLASRSAPSLKPAPGSSS